MGGTARSAYLFSVAIPSSPSSLPWKVSFTAFSYIETVKEKEENGAYSIKDGAGTSYRGKEAANGSKKLHQEAKSLFSFPLN